MKLVKIRCVGMDRIQLAQGTILTMGSCERGNEASCSAEATNFTNLRHALRRNRAQELSKCSFMMRNLESRLEQIKTLCDIAPPYNVRKQKAIFLSHPKTQGFESLKALMRRSHSALVLFSVHHRLKKRSRKKIRREQEK